MQRSSSSILVSFCLPLLFGGAMVSACDAGGEVGAPCESADDCSGDLICDVHDGQGSCQPDHPHGEPESESEAGTEHSHETENESSDHDTETEDTDHSHETESESSDHDTETEDTDHSHETEATDTDHSHETEATDTDHGDDTDGSSSGSSSGGGDDLCAAHCACLSTTCSALDGYPYADDAECLLACESWDEATLSCFGGFCEQATVSESDLLPHLCEHAWGALGQEEC